MKRRTINRFFIVSVMMLLLAMAFPAIAHAKTGDVAAVGGKTFSTYSEAWSYVVAEKGGTINLLADWNTTQALKVPEGVEITLNLNGHMINRHLASDDSSASKKDGEVIYVSDSATLNVNGGDTSIVHNGRLSNGVWYADPSASQTNVSGGVIAGGYSCNGAGAIHMKAASKVNLSQVTLCGNMSDDFWAVSGGGYGGAIEMDGEHTTLKLVGSTISYNYADIDGGGLYANKSYSSITLDAASSIDHNTAKRHGGGIYTDASSLELAGGSVTNNSCGKDGGGIYINHKVTNVTGMKISNNTAKGNGGGAYIDAGGTATLMGCTINGNTAVQGGGVYDNGNNNGLGDCTIKGNHASEDYGGGVYVSSVDDISLSGTMVISENTATSDSHANDLHLGDTGAHALITSMPDYTSKIGIYTTRDSGRALSKSGTYTASVFFSNVANRYINWVPAAQGGSRELLWEKGTAPAPVSPTTVTPGTSKVGTYEGSDLIKGTFTYASNVNNTDDLDSVFYYSDGFFSKDPSVYDNHLATMSLNLAMSAFGANAGSSTSDYSNKFSHVKQLFSDIGCNDSKTYIKETYTQKPGTDTIGVAISQKNIKVDGNDYVLVPIAIRGAGYESEWASNVTVGENGEEEGFANAADQVTADVVSYIKNDPALLEAAKKGKVKFWVVGFSRAGATANLTSKRLVDGIPIYDDSSAVYSGNQVYGYCTAAPQGGLKSKEYYGAKYNCIHNIINKSDLVPLVAMSQMGFKRYGVDHYMPGGTAGAVVDSSSTTDTNQCDNTQLSVDYTSSAYLNQRALMLAQLTAVNRTITFEDYYHAATLNIFKSGIGLSATTTEVNVASYSKDAGNLNSAENFESSFMEKLQTWALGTDASLYRYNYATKVSALSTNGMSLQDALRDVAGMLKSKSPTDLAGLESAMGGVTGNLKWYDELAIYNDVVLHWNSATDASKKDYLNEFWGLLMNSNGYSPCVGDYLTATEKQTLAKDWPVLGDFLFTLVCQDRNYDVDLSSGSTETQVYIGTLLYNSGTIALGHCPEVYLSWLRSYDDFYTKDTTPIDVDTSSVTVKKPTANLADGSITGDTPLELSSSNAGGAIYYRVHKQAYGYDNQSEWKLYSGSIPLTMYGSLDTTYTVEAYVMAYGKKSDTATFTYNLGKTKLYVSVATDASLQHYQVTETKLKIAEKVTLDPKSPDGTYFVKWTAKVWDKATETWKDAPEVLGDQATNPYATFTMPKAEVTVKAEYRIKINKMWLSIDTSTFDTGKTTLPSTAQWHCLGYYGYHSSGWVKDPSSMYDEYPNGIPVPITWTKGESSGGKTAYTASMTFFPTPSQHFTTADPGLPSEFLFASKVNVTVNGQQQPAQVATNADGSVTVVQTFQVTDPPATHTITVNCNDTYAGSVMESEKRTYEYAAGSAVSLPAPSVADETFVGWKVDDTYITDANASDLAIAFTMPDSNVELTANYIPVVKNIDLVFTAPQAGDALSTSIDSCKVTITDEHTIPSENVSLTWSPADTTVDYATVYTAKVQLTDAALDKLKSKFALSDNAQITVNGAAVSSEALSKDAKGNPVLTLVFPVTDNPNLVSVSDPPAVEGIAHGTSADDILSGKLSSTAAIVTEAGAGTASVTWNSIDGYNPENLDEQTCTAHGTITLPEGVENGNKVSLDVTEKFTVDAISYNLTSVTQPADLDDQENGVALKDIPLPSTVAITTNPAGPTSANVAWDLSSVDYDPTIAEEQTIVIGGKVVLPEYVTTTDDSLVDVCLVVTVKAKVIVRFTLTYKPDSEDHGSLSLQREVVDAEQTAEGSTATAATGYTFVNWTSGDTVVSANEKLEPGIPTADKSYVANFRAHTYTVKFDANDGSNAPKDQDMTYGKSAELNKATEMKRLGYTFLGWSTDKNATKSTYADGQQVQNLTDKDDATVTLYAVWVKLSDALISYNSADSAMGSCDPVKETVAAGAAPLSAKGSTAKPATGYHFDTTAGWTIYGSESTTPVSTTAEITSETVDKVARAHGLYNSVALVAHFAANTYTVSFDGNGGTGSMESLGMTYGTSAKLTANGFSYAGRTFTGWSRVKGATTVDYADEQSVLNLAGGDKDTLTLYAVWTTNEKVTLTYAPDDASHGTVSPVSESLPSGSSFKGSTAKANPGYHFMNWTLSGSETLVSADAAIKPGTATANTAYVAHFKGNPYTVRFNANAPSGATVEGSMSDETGFVYGTAKPLTANTLTCKGYVFAGWKVGDSSRYIADGAQVNDLTTGDPAASELPIVTLHAVWFALPEAAVSYSVAASADGAVHGACNPAAESVGGTSVTPPSGSTVSPEPGYHFDASEGNAWTYTTVQGKTGSAGNAAVLTSDQAAACCSVTSGKSLYYVPCAFTAHVAANAYTVKFDANGGVGDAMLDEAFTYDADAVALTANSYTRAGYSFVGWNTRSDGDGDSYENAQKVSNLTTEQNGEVKLYAQWRENWVTMSYVADGAGDVDMESDSFGAVNGEPLSVGATANTGYHVSGWTYSNASGTGSAGSMSTLTSDAITAVAKASGIYVDTTFTAHFAANTYTVKFDANGGTGAPSQQTMTYGTPAKLNKAAEIARSGYTFLGWSTDQGAQKATYEDAASVQDLSVVDEDTITLYAVWSANDQGGNTDKADGGSSATGSSASGGSASGRDASGAAAPSTSDSSLPAIAFLIIVFGLAASLLVRARINQKRARRR